MKTINVDQIVSVKTHDKYLSYTQIIKTVNKKLFRKSETFFELNNYWNESRYKTAEDAFNENFDSHKFVLLNNKVYIKPSLIITFSNNRHIEEFYDKYEDALKKHNYVKSLIKNSIDSNILKQNGSN